MNLTEYDVYAVLWGLFALMMILVPLTCHLVQRAIDRAYEQGRLDERMRPLPEEWL